MTYSPIPTLVTLSQLQMCDDCGAVVFRTNAHDAWHLIHDRPPEELAMPVVFDAWNRPDHSFTGKRQYGLNPRPEHTCARCGVMRKDHP